MRNAMLVRNVAKDKATQAGWPLRTYHTGKTDLFFSFLLFVAVSFPLGACVSIGRNETIAHTSIVIFVVLFHLHLEFIFMFSRQSSSSSLSRRSLASLSLSLSYAFQTLFFLCLSPCLFYRIAFLPPSPRLLAFNVTYTHLYNQAKRCTISGFFQKKKMGKK